MFKVIYISYLNAHTRPRTKSFLYITFASKGRVRFRFSLLQMHIWSKLNPFGRERERERESERARDREKARKRVRERAQEGEGARE